MHPTLAFLSWTPADLVNHLWQSSVIALALLLLMALCARLSARTRLALGWMALAKFALPFGIFATFVTLLGGNPEQWAVSRLFPAPFELSDSAATIPAADLPPVGPATPESVDPVALAASSASQGESPVSQKLSEVPSLPRVLMLVWLAGCAGLYGWWIIGGARLRRRLLAEAKEVSPAMAASIAAAAAKAGVRRLPRCLAVPHGSGPGLLGVWTPILALPPALEEKLTPAELESVLIHELIHLKRRDPLWLAVHVAAVSALWFNPLAWLLSRWIRLETEKACDERVLELTGQPDTYARGILKVVHLALGLPEPRLLSVITPPVVSRVKNILRHGSRPDQRWLRAAVLGAGAFLLALGGQVGSVAGAAVRSETESIRSNQSPRTADAAAQPAVTGETLPLRDPSAWSFTPAAGTGTGPATLLAQSNPKPPSAGEIIQGWDGVTVFRGPITNTALDPEVKRLAELLVRIATEQVTLASARERYMDRHPVVQAQVKVLQDLLGEKQGLAANQTKHAQGQQMAIGTVVRQLGQTKEDLAKLQLNLSENSPEVKAKLGEVDRLENILIAVRNGTFGRASDVPMTAAQPAALSSSNGEARSDPVPSYRFNPATGNAEVSGFTYKPPVAVAATAAVPSRSRDNDTLSVDFPDQDIRGILRSVADLFELNIIIPEVLEGKTTVKLRDVTWRQIFKAVLDPLDHTFLEEGNIIRIVRKPMVPPAVRTVMVTLDHAKASDLAPSLSGMIDGASGGKLVIDVRSNALVITETPAKLERLREMVSLLDRAAAKGMIETQIVPVTPTDIRNLGQSARESAEPVKLNPVDSVGANGGGPSPTWSTYSGTDLLDRIPSPLSQKRPIYPTSLVEKGTEGSVTVGFTVDPVGNILNLRVLSSTDREFEQAALDAVKQWRIGPGKKGGRFVATNLSVVLNFRPPAPVKTSDTIQPTAVFAAASTTPPAPAAEIAHPGPLPRGRAPEDTEQSPGMVRVWELKDLDQIPTPSVQAPPNYPPELKRKGTEGFAEVAFVVDAQGNVQNVRVLSSSMREFERAAMEAISKWKFKPGRKGGKPVATNMSVPINFRLDGAGKTTSSPQAGPVFAAASSAPTAADGKTTPATAARIVPVQPVTPTVYSLKELDAIPSPTLQAAPVYPADLKRMGVEGRVIVTFVVDANGLVQNVGVVDSTDPRFEVAALRAVSRWKFKPGRKGGKPVATALDVPINFHLAGNK
jgi:TonB family protein